MCRSEGSDTNVMRDISWTKCEGNIREVVEVKEQLKWKG